MSTLLTISVLRSHLMASGDVFVESRFPQETLPIKNSVIKCNSINSCCRFAEGLTREMSLVTNLDQTQISCPFSKALTASITCLHCNKAQFFCSICGRSFNKKQNLIQHINHAKCHSNNVHYLSTCLSDKGMTSRYRTSQQQNQANNHLDLDLHSTDDNSDCMFDNNWEADEPENNAHLEFDLGTDSDTDSSDDEIEIDSHNFKTKQALERHRLVDDVLRLMEETNSKQCSETEDLDLMELRLVVGRALGVDDKADCLRIHPIDASRHLLFTNLMESLTESKREDLLLLLRLNRVVEKIFTESSKWMKTDLSSDTNTLKKVNLKGPTSIKKALDINQVKHECQGAYSDIIDSIHSLMLQQGPMTLLQDVLSADTTGVVSTILQCRKVQRMGREMWNEAILDKKDPKKIVPQFVFIWDDGFDNTESKSGVGGLSMGTVTSLDLVTGNMSRLRSHTDVVSLSRSSDDHDKIIGMLLSQLRELRKPFKTFHRTMGEVWAMVRVVNVNRDRVQRNKVCGVLAHNGKYNQRWKYVLPPRGDERETFYSCNSCFNRRVRACSQPGPIDPLLNSECTECCDFDINKNVHLQTVNIHNKCPTKVLAGSPKPPSVIPISTTNRRRCSFKLNFKMMRMAMRTAAYHCVKNFWTNEETEYFLKEIGINTSAVNRILQYKESNANRDTQDVIDEMEQCQYNNVIPHVWQFDDVCDIDDNIDPLMHMLFEGIVKVLYKEVIPNTIKLFKVDMDCMGMIQEQLKSVRKLSVSWIRTEALAHNTLKPSGWRGVDFVAAARMMKNCISHIKVAINKKGGKHLQTKLQKYQIFEQFICSCHSMICRVMCDSCSEESINDIEHHIKMFLSSSERYCKLVLNKGNKKTFMSQKGNFLSLLNIPDEMRQYGPLRRYWDGDYEAFVKLIKEVLPGGLKRTGTATLVSKLIRFKERTSLMMAWNTSMEYLLTKNVAKEAVEYDRNKPVHIYQSLTVVEEMIKKNVPLSAVVVMAEDDTPAILIIYKIKSMKRIHEHSDQHRGEQALNCLTVNWNTKKGMWIAGQFYIPFNVQEKVAYKQANVGFSVIRRNHIQNVVLIPDMMSTKSDDNTQLRCVLADDWKELNHMSDFKLGSIQESTFQNTNWVPYQ